MRYNIKLILRAMPTLGDISETVGLSGVTMTSEDKVKTKYPKAMAVRYSTNGNESYYLVWSEGTERGIRLSEGKTKSNAFVNAAVAI